MKANEIIKLEDILEDDCEVCTLHTEAYEKMGNNIYCPHCKESIMESEIRYDSEIEVVGETNYYSEEQNIETMLVRKCPHCGKYIGFKAIPIIYNGNHDIYYTGGKDYLVTDKIQLTDKIKKSIQQYTDRIKEGENLESWNLETWLSYDIENMVAEILYKHGFKY